MKLITLIIGLFIINSASGQTNILESVKQNAATNINQAVIQILAGVKDASGEIYGVSKTVIANSYEFVKTEAPEVIKEFLRWHLVRACVIIVALSLVSFLLFWNANKWDDGGMGPPAIIVQTLALGLLLGGLIPNVLIIGKILAAPRVYIIEYVVDTVQNHK